MTNQFDITEHEWSDHKGTAAYIDGTDNTISITPYCPEWDDPDFHSDIGAVYLEINKEDAIAIAKHFVRQMTTEEFNEIAKERFGSNMRVEYSCTKTKYKKMEYTGSDKDFMSYTSPSDRTIATFTLKEGDKVVISKIPQSETDYLFSTPANKQRLEESINQLEQGKTVETIFNSEIGEVKRYD